MKPLLYLIAGATIIDGALHLLFPERWGSLWAQSLMTSVPVLGERAEDAYVNLPAHTKRAQGFFWIALGAALLWFAGPAERR